MNGAFQPFRVLRKHDTQIMYAAIPDLKQWFQKLKSDCKTTDEEAFWEQVITKLDAMIYEGLDHDP